MCHKNVIKKPLPLNIRDKGAFLPLRYHSCSVYTALVGAISGAPVPAYSEITCSVGGSGVIRDLPSLLPCTFRQLSAGAGESACPLQSLLFK